MNTEDLVRTIVARVMEASARDTVRYEPAAPIPVEISARHVHLSRSHVDELFGSGYALTPERPLSQHGQYLCRERVRVIGPAGVFANVAVLGPIRGDTQVELSAGDARILGLAAPLRMSGDLAGAADVMLGVGDRFTRADGSAIVARNHIHMTPTDAARFAVHDGDEVGVRVAGGRTVVFDSVPVRVDNDFALAMHIDFDEANACMCDAGSVGVIIRKNAAATTAEQRGGARPKHPERLSPSPPLERRIALSGGRKGKPSRVVSAETARKLAVDNESVRLPGGSVVTPLAWDVFRAAGTRVEIARGDGKETAC